MEKIIQNFKGVVPPVRLTATNTANGVIVPVIDWQAIAQKHLPTGAKNPQFEFVLEYFTATYYLPTLLRIPGRSYEELNFTASQKGIERALKLVEFKSKFPPSLDYSIQFLFWNCYDNVWSELHFDRDTLFNTGMEGRINLIKPYLVSVGDTIFGDKLYKLGLSIAPRPLQGDDAIYLHGGYSGSISYLWEEPEVILQEGLSGKRTVGTVGQEITSEQPRRAVLYFGNAGTKRVYWKFGGSPDAMATRVCPFLEPGESLTFEHGQLVYPGGNSQHLLGKNANSICKLSLNAISEEGVNDCVFQELLYPL